jgi:rubrerythrin
MKLEKREITLNEKDSITDMLYLEKTLLSVYEKGLKTTESKQAKGFCQEKIAEIQGEIVHLQREIENICFSF